MPPDANFWWARTEWHFPEEGFSAETKPSGLDFFAFASAGGGDLRIGSFGAVATFGLQPDRLPHSPSGRWRSAPHVELFGKLFGRTVDADIFTGDTWSKCRMIRRQTVLQRVFGGARVLNERIEPQKLISRRTPTGPSGSMCRASNRCRSRS